MKLRKVLAFITASTLVLNTVVGSLPAAAEDPSTGTSEGGSPAANGWSGTSGSYTYTTDGTEGNSFSFELSSASEISSVTDWSGYQYMSLTVTNNNSDESKMIGAGLNFNDEWDGGWINGGKSLTCLVETKGVAPAAGEAIWFDPTERTAFDAGESVTISNITFYASADDVVLYNKWYTTDNSTYIYKTQTAETEISDYFNFDLDNAGVTDWSAITYISADVSVTGKAKPSINGDDLSGNSKELENSSATLYLNLNGSKPEWVNIGANWYDDNGNCIAAGTTITVSNIKYSTTERDYTNVYDEWYYLSSDNSWNYKAENDSKDLSGSLNLDTSSVSNWSAIKYISAKVNVTGKAKAAISAGTPTDFFDSNSKLIENDTQTIYLDTNGTTLDWINIETWTYDDNDSISITAGTTIKVTDITFSTNERDYSDAYDEWFTQNGKLCYRMSSTSTYDALTDIDIPSTVDMSKVKYVSADVTITGSLGDNGMRLSAYVDDNTSIDGKYETTSATLLVDTSNRTDYAGVNFWAKKPATGEVLIEIDLSSITFSTTERSYDDVYDEWYYLSSDNSWNYKAKTKKDWVGTPAFDSSSVTDWSKIKYISADVEVTGDAYPVICATDKNNTEKAVNGSAIVIKDTTRTIYLNTDGAELQDVRLDLWGFGDGDNYAAVKDGVVIKITNITFSENERDYTNAYNEWYPVTGGWQIKIEGEGTKPIDNLPSLNFDRYMTIPSFTIAEIEVNIENGTSSYGATLYNGSDVTKGFHRAEASTGKKAILATDYENNYNNLCVSVWDATAGTIVTVSTPKFSTATSIPNYKDYANVPVEFEKGKYYFHSSGVEVNESSEANLSIPYSGDISKIQSIKVTGYANPELNSNGWTGTAQISLGSDGVFGHTFPLTDTLSTVERYYLGSLKGNFITLNMTCFHADAEIVITAIEYNLDPVALPLSTPNDILIDYSETVQSSSNNHTISASDVKKIETTGTIRFDLEFLPNTPKADGYWYALVFSDWTLPALEGGWANLCTDSITESCTIEYKITKEDVEHIKRCGDSFVFVIQASEGIKSSNVWFTPDSDAPVPESEKFNPDQKFNAQERQEFNQKLDKSKGNQMTELEAVKNVKDKNKYEMPQGHRYNKKDKSGNDVYSLRIVKMVDKKKLANAKSITITCYSQKSGKYVTIKATSCYGQLNINGSICEAEEDMAFLTVVFDNVQGDDVITYTDFTINY